MTSTLAVTAIAAMSFLLQGDVTFDGIWKKNLEESDDAQQKMRDAMSQMAGSAGRGGGGRRGGGGGGGRRGGGSASGARGERGGQRPPGMGGAPDSLTLEHESGELRVDDGDRLTIYYLDGEEHRRETPNGDAIETVAELRGYKVVVEESMERGESSREFELSPTGDVMVVTTTLKMERLSEPVVIRSVYERDEASEDEEGVR